MEMQYTLVSCGIGQIAGLNNTGEAIVRRVLEYYVPDIQTYRAWQNMYIPKEQTKAVIFSDNNHYENGDRLAQFIKDNALGDVEETKSWYNTTGNRIKLWLWILDIENMWSYVHKT